MDRWGWNRRRANPVERRCERCNKKFKTTAPRLAKYCSPRCRAAANYEQRPKPVRQTTFKCVKCSRSFTAKNKNALYCSARCRQKASRETRKQMKGR